MDLEQDVVEMEHIRMGLGMGIGNLSGSTRTAVGDGTGECDITNTGTDCHGGSPAPAYHSLEMGFRARGPSLDDVRGIRIDVEKTSTTM